MTIALDLTVNSHRKKVQIEETATLLEVLRDVLGLVGTKRGCNHGVCGACTVLIDDAPQRACLKLAATCEDLEITTVEGISRLEHGAALQNAFAEAGAVQCGFCTAGFLMSARALLSTKPRPAIEDVRHALAGNICRCTGYRKIIDAVLQAAERTSQ